MLFSEVEDGGDGVDVIVICEVILLVLIGLDGLDDGADVTLIQDGLSHLRHVHSRAPEEELLHQELDPVKVILIRGASLELDLSQKI